MRNLPPHRDPRSKADRRDRRFPATRTHHGRPVALRDVRLYGGGGFAAGLSAGCRRCGRAGRDRAGRRDGAVFSAREIRGACPPDRPFAGRSAIGGPIGASRTSQCRLGVISPTAIAESTLDLYASVVERWSSKLRARGGPSSPHCMTILVPITLFGWVPCVLLLFLWLPPRRAVITAFMGGWLFLPAATFQLPGIPDYSKMAATCAGVLLAALIFDTETLLSFRPRWFDLPMLVLGLLSVRHQRGRKHRHVGFVFVVRQPGHYLGHALFHRSGLFHRCRIDPRAGDRILHQRTGLHSDLPVRNPHEPAALANGCTDSTPVIPARDSAAGGRRGSWQTG